MSLFIHPSKVTHVLLADGWHKVDFEVGQSYVVGDGKTPQSTFDLDSYEYGYSYRYSNHHDEKFRVLHGGGQEGICATGFTFREDKVQISGPLTSVLAVKHRTDKFLPSETER